MNVRPLWPGLLVIAAARAVATPDAGAPAFAGRCGEWSGASAPVRGSIAAGLAGVVPDDGGALAAHYARIFMWDLDLRHDVLSGDQMRVLWRQGADGQPEIAAAQYLSTHLQRTLRAYRFRGPGDGYASYWDEHGVEVPRRLKASPLRDYEQITALLKDRPTHQGMDFKTPVGTEVTAPKAATVSRLDWKRKGNGRCLELRYDDGVTAKFLHLSAIKVSAGARVRPGQVIALSGNTGHSTAPHLHYQLGRGAKILDPVDYHGTTRRRLSGPALTAFQAAVAALDKSCPTAAPVRAQRRRPKRRRGVRDRWLAARR